MHEKIKIIWRSVQNSTNKKLNRNLVKRVNCVVGLVCKNGLDYTKIGKKLGLRTTFVESFILKIEAISSDFIRFAIAKRIKSIRKTGEHRKGSNGIYPLEYYLL